MAQVQTDPNLTALRVNLLCKEHGIGTLTAVDQMASNRDHAYVQVGISSDPGFAVAIFDVTKLLAQSNAEGDKYHAFLRQASSMLGEGMGSIVGGISKESAQRDYGRLVRKDNILVNPST